MAIDRDSLLSDAELSIRSVQNGNASGDGTLTIATSIACSLLVIASYLKDIVKELKKK